MDILSMLIVGLIAGWIASQIMRGRGLGIIGDIIVGIIGALLGGYIFGLLGVTAGGLLGTIISSIIGAVILLLLISLIRSSTTPTPHSPENRI